MALKRALVVDDSKSARLALKKQLEAYYLHVDLAESGEDALEYLQSHMVDVIFMDHIMPGMDGLEAMSVIKKNPLTATIPVMMYTSKEGEVYVSQARALGAVGVLPKQVQPGVLFGMLAKLGLVHDRRAATGSDDAEALPPAEERRGKAGSEQFGMTVTSLVSRILDDQRRALRADMQSGYEDFATHVAEEVHNRIREDQIAATRQAATDNRRGPWLFVSGALAIAALLLGTWLMQASSERAVLRDNLAQLSAELEKERAVSRNLSRQLAANLDAELTQSDSAVRALLGTLVWTMNESATVPYGELPFNAARTAQIRELIERLVDAGYAGPVRVESHLGEFCLVSDSTGVYRLADPAAPIASCSVFGHPLDDSRLLADRQTQEFQRFVSNSPLVNGSGIDLEVVVHDRSTSIPRMPYPAGAEFAGEWNEVAAENNRLEFSLAGSDAS